jgi:GAF domain-containing protein
MNLFRNILKNETQKYALVGVIFGFLFPIFGTIIRISTTGFPYSISSIFQVQRSDPLMWIINTAPVFLGVFAAIAGRRQDISNKLNDDINQITVELENSRRDLETRVKERTAALELRAAQLETISNTARIVAAIQELSTLLPEITHLVSERFGFYHAGIFLIDEAHEFAVLQAANSEGGRRMLERQHRLPLDINSIVGYVTSLGEARIALDVGSDSVYFNNPDLPATRSEMALPLRVGGQVIGALDVQSTEKSAFSRDDIHILTILADQIAVAIENARLFGEAKGALSTAEATFEKFFKKEWSHFSQQVKYKGFVFDGKQVSPISTDTEILGSQNLPQTDSLMQDQVNNTVRVSIKLRGQTIGMLNIRSKKGRTHWTQDELAILEASADRVALALENARLVDGAQRRAARERAIGEISTKIGSVSDRDLILQAAVEELGRKIGNTEVILELERESS